MVSINSYLSNIAERYNTIIETFRIILKNQYTFINH